MVLKTQGPPAGSAGYAGEESGGQCGGAQDTLSPKFLSLCMNHGMRGVDVSLVSAEAQATSVRKPSKDHTWVTPGPGILQKEEGGREPEGELCRRTELCAVQESEVERRWAASLGQWLALGCSRPARCLTGSPVS